MEFTPDPKPPKKKKKAKSGCDPKYLEWLKTQPCSNPNCHGCVLPSIPAHQRILGNGGTGIKPPDKDALPLGYWCHTEEHKGSITFWLQGSKPKTKIFIQKLCDDHIKRYGEFLK